MKKKQDSFVRQATFLMVAGLIVRIIGLLYRTPMKAAIGGLGYGYYGYAFNVYNILLLISGYSIPVAVSKLMAERIAKKEYANAQRVFYGAMIYILVMGSLAGGAAFIFAKQLLPAGAEGAVLALRVLAPVILLAGLLGVMRGFFQANSTMVPTSISQILEQVVNAFVSVGAAIYLIKIYGSSEEAHAAYGAAGGTMGTAAGVLIGILFMLLVFLVNRSYIKRRLKRDQSRHIESASEIGKVILLMMTPVIFATFIYNVSAYIDQTVFAPLMMKKGMDGAEIATIYGVFSGQYMVLINIPIALANASSTAMMPQISGVYALGNYEKAREKIQEAIRMTMFVAIPSAVGLGVLSYPIMDLLFPASPKSAGAMLAVGSVSVLFYSLSTITNGVLQGIGKQHLPLRNAAVSLGINIVVLVVLCIGTDLGIYSVLAATMAYSLTMCILNNISVRKHLSFQNEWKETYGIPFLASLLMGIVAALVYFGLHVLIKQVIICLVPAIVFAIFTYLLLFVKFMGISSREMGIYPFGSLIVRLVRPFKVFTDS